MTEKKPARFDLANLNFLGGLLRQFRLVWMLLQDSRVPLWAKAIVPLSVLYLISPVDFIPDVALGLGQLDDLGVILLGMTLFVKMCPPNIVEYYQSRLEYGPDQHSEAIDTTYRVIDEDKP
jgi:uncharacterized membrane protein YkvA (DUF1232 family)